MLRDITIHAVLNGFTVQIGCQQVVFTSREELIGNLSAYPTNPEEVEKHWCDSAINARHTFSRMTPEREAGLDVRTPSGAWQGALTSASNTGHRIG